MKDLGLAQFFIGLEIKQDRPNYTIYLHQSAYISSILIQFGMQDCKGLSTPMEVNAINTFMDGKDAHDKIR